MSPGLALALALAEALAWTLVAGLGFSAQALLWGRADSDRKWFESRARYYLDIPDRTPMVIYAGQEMLDAARVAARHRRGAVRHGTFKLFAFAVGVNALAHRQFAATTTGLLIGLVLIAVLALLTYDGFDSLRTRSEFFGLNYPAIPGLPG